MCVEGGGNLCKSFDILVFKGYERTDDVIMGRVKVRQNGTVTMCYKWENIGGKPVMTRYPGEVVPKRSTVPF
jgi:hypothetical protein